MDSTINERQSKFKEKFYKAGFKQSQIWIKREERKKIKFDIRTFIHKFKKLTKGWSEDNISALLGLFIKITVAKKEEKKIKERQE